MIGGLAGRAREALRVVGTWGRIARGSSDYATWSSGESLRDDWDERTRLIAAMIPARATVLELGAGRQALRSLLPPGCRYLAADLVARDAATIACDLNARPLPALPRADVIVMSGVLEFVHDPAGLLSLLSRLTEAFVVSYACRRSRLRAETWSRRALGWVNDLTREEVVALFAGHGFRLADERTWSGQRLFHVRRAGDDGPPALR